jgi:hypothetical protein
MKLTVLFMACEGHLPEIAEIDIKPLVLRGSEPVDVDALVVLSG